MQFANLEILYINFPIQGVHLLIAELKEHVGSHMVLVLAANKADLYDSIDNGVTLYRGRCAILYDSIDNGMILYIGRCATLYGIIAGCEQG